MHHELPARLDLDWYRKQAKQLVRAWGSRDPDALARVDAVLGARAHERFALSDAQWVIASEHGCRSWAEFRRRVEAGDIGLALETARATWGERAEIRLDSGLAYGGRRRVLVHVTKRAGRYKFSDDGAAIEEAGKPAGWRDVADQIEAEFVVNVSRSGSVWLPATERQEPAWLTTLPARIAEASAAFYGELLELDGRLHSGG